ncbi:hypothetical protein SAMN05443144_110110 [Fodinibius roseus]|uniref:META domain-containing protein n=1 Tax=Fodinibius roseus TaxID=1194090 RepID=A0A1M5CWL7_9BACT|nr:hypothetical protein [Fodinibius roseus]SHF58957.1 hypothetical protein SAMN05443144_110110 [Fodinibius roseus]
MKTLITTLIVFILGIALGVACEDTQPWEDNLAEADTTLVGPTWQLIAFVEDDGDRILVEDLPESGRIYSVEFTTQSAEECVDTEDPPYGTWCMRIAGHPNSSPSTTYDLDSKNRSLKIYFRGTTFVYPPEGAKETKFFKALDATTHYQINGKELRLFYKNEKVLLFEPAEAEQE